MSPQVPAEVERAEAEIEALTARLRPHYRRGAGHRHVGEYVRGLLGSVERKNGWQLAEQAGHRHPRTIQRVLDRLAWDADAVRGDLLDEVVAELGDEDGVLVDDETGCLKQGTKTCGVARQYSGTAGRIETCQIGVFLGYASAKGWAGIDRALYLPREWADDAERREEVGVPGTVPFRTKPALALEMLERAFEADVPARWVVGAAVYGSDGKLRRALEAWGQAYALAVKSTEKPTTFPPYQPPGQVMAAEVADALEPDAWQRVSCGEGAQGERLYDWAGVPLRPGLEPGWVHALVIRRDIADPDERAYSLVFAPTDTTLAEIVRAIGARWTIEDVFKLAFKFAKRQVGLDQYEVRSWMGWHRLATLALLALATLALLAHATLALLALATLVLGAAQGGTHRRTPTSSPSPSRSCAAS